MALSVVIGTDTFILDIPSQFQPKITALLAPFTKKTDMTRRVTFTAKVTTETISLKNTVPRKGYFYREYTPYNFALITPQVILSISLLENFATVHCNAANDDVPALIYHSFKWFIIHYTQFHGALPLHSSLVVNNENGMLFCGHSGSGKSTICDLLTSGFSSLLRGSDELNFINSSNGKYMVTPTPFTSSAGVSQITSSRKLQKLFFINQAPCHAIKPLTRPSLFNHLLTNCYTIPGSTMHSNQVLDRIEQLSSKISAEMLYFNNNRSIYHFIRPEWSTTGDVSM